MAEQILKTTKRFQISKAQQITLLEVLGASLALGACLVIANFLIKYIDFNAKVIGAKNDAITDYDTTIRAVGVCQDSDRNGRLSDKELADCDPETVALENVVGSLRYNIYEIMANNSDLELVARKREEGGICFTQSGKAIDYTALYKSATTDTQREQALTGMKTCSALRVISDAIPSNKNTEALMASLNAIFIASGIEPEGISPSDGGSEVDADGVGLMPLSFSVEGTGTEVLTVIDNVERSIRSLDFVSASFEWSESGISMRASANAYYLDSVDVLEVKKTVKATDKNTTKKSSGSILNTNLIRVGGLGE